jgi:hypothetical protein
MRERKSKEQKKEREKTRDRKLRNGKQVKQKLSRCMIPHGSKPSEHCAINSEGNLIVMEIAIKMSCPSVHVGNIHHYYH